MDRNPPGGSFELSIGRLVLMAAPAVVLAALVRDNGVNVPWQDQWELVPLLGKVRDGTLGFADLFAQHNEHRIFFPRILMLGLARATSWNVRYEMGLSLLLAAAGFLVFLKLYHWTGDVVHADFQAGPPVLAAWIFFSAAQWENWLWGWQIQWSLNVLAVLGTVLALAGPAGTLAPARLGLAVAGAVVATYSLGGGLLVWIVCLIPLLCLRRGRGAVAVWIAAGLLVWFSYFATYLPAPGRPAIGTVLRHPAELALFVLAVLGRVFITPLLAAAAAGAILLIGLLFAVWHLARRAPDRLRQVSPWLALAAFALLEAGAAAVTRLGLGLEVASSSRYASISAMLAVPALVLGAAAFSVDWTDDPTRERRRGIVFGAAAALVAVGIASGWGEALPWMAEHRRQQIEAVLLLSDLKSAPDARLRSIYPDLPKLKRLVPLLRDLGLGGLGHGH